MRLDYTNLTVFTKAAPPPADFTGNYVYLKSPKMSQLVVQEHKTASTYGTLTRKIPEPIYRLILQWKKANPDTPLLAMTPNVLGRLITRIFMKHTGKPVTMNDLRHSYVSAARAGDRKLSEVRRIATELGHSILTNEAYRRD
jgi:integrase